MSAPAAGLERADSDLDVVHVIDMRFRDRTRSQYLCLVAIACHAHCGLNQNLRPRRLPTVVLFLRRFRVVQHCVLEQLSFCHLFLL